MNYYKKGTLQSTGEGYTELILDPAFAFLWGPREARKESEGIIIQYVKDTTNHGTTQACIWDRHHILHHVRTIGKRPYGKMSWSDQKRDLPSISWRYQVIIWTSVGFLDRYRAWQWLHHWWVMLRRKQRPEKHGLSWTWGSCIIFT